MKSTAFMLITLAVGSLASPTIPAISDNDIGGVQAASNERIVTGQIIRAIEDMARQIREAGLDPFKLDLAINYELPVPVIFSAKVILDNLLLTGLSNIVVERMNYSVLQNRLTFTIALPSIALSIGNSETKIILFAKEYTGSANGRISINAIRIAGDIRIRIGIIGGISIRSMSLQFSLGGIDSDLNINLLNTDLSSRVNTLLGTTIPNTLKEYAKEINELIEIIALELVNNILNRYLVL